MNIEKKIVCWAFPKAHDLRDLLCVNEDILVITFDNIKINPLEPPLGVKPMAWASIFCDSLHSLTLNVGSQGLIIKSLRELYEDFSSVGYYPSLFDLYNFIKKLKFSPYSRFSGYKDSIINRLELLLDGTCSSVFDCSRGHTNSLISIHTIFEILYLTEVEQSFINNYFISYLFHYKLINETGLTHIVVIDDANLIFFKGAEYQESLPNIHHLLSTVRKSSVHIWAATQSPSLMGSSIHSNAFAKVMFSLSYGKDIDSMVQSMGIKDPEQRAYCHTLKPREAVVKYAGMEPFLAKIPEIKI